MLHHERRGVRQEIHNYDSPGYYFITICTKNRKNYFGEIKNNKIELSTIGIIIKKCWQEIPIHFNEVKLGMYSIMPNHFHGIIHIIVGNGHARSLRWIKMQKGNNKRQFEAIPVIIGSFKSAATKLSHKIDNKFTWQKSYFDKFINNRKMYNDISQYIEHNVDNWENDEFNKE